MTWTCEQKRSVSVTVASLGVMFRIFPSWRSVSVTLSSSGVLFPPVSVKLILFSRACLYRLDNLFCWGVAVAVCSMAMLELAQNSWISFKIHSPHLALPPACAAGTTAGVFDDISTLPLRAKNKYFVRA